MSRIAARRLRLGTRKSPLALAQSSWVARRLEDLHPGCTVELVPIVTQGDRTPGDLAAFGGKGLFTEELESGLLDGTLDLAVHSLKDLPVHLPEGLEVASYPPREDPRDALVSATAGSLDELAPGDVVLTGALRRRAQVLHWRPDVRVEPLRGNVGTRVRKWREAGAAAVVLAFAGLRRLDLEEDLPIHPLDAERFIPAPGQGTLAVEVKVGSPAAALCQGLDHQPTREAAAAERRIVEALGADCTLPLGAWCRAQDGQLRVLAVLATDDGERMARAEGRGDTPREAADACLAALAANGSEAIRAELGS